MCRRDGGEQKIDSRKYTERVRGLINESIDAIAATDNERRDVLQRWRLPEALGVRCMQPAVVQWCARMHQLMMTRLANCAPQAAAAHHELRRWSPSLPPAAGGGSRTICRGSH